jgi:hypothetical protein
VSTRSKENFLGSRARPAQKSERIAAGCEAVVYTKWNPPQPDMSRRHVAGIALILLYFVVSVTTAATDTINTVTRRMISNILLFAILS